MFKNLKTSAQLTNKQPGSVTRLFRFWFASQKFEIKINKQLGKNLATATKEAFSDLGVTQCVLFFFFFSFFWWKVTPKKKFLCHLVAVDVVVAVVVLNMKPQWQNGTKTVTSFGNGSLLDGWRCCWWWWWLWPTYAWGVIANRDDDQQKAKMTDTKQWKCACVTQEILWTIQVNRTAPLPKWTLSVTCICCCCCF